MRLQFAYYFNCLFYKKLCTEAGSDLLISMLEKPNWFHLTGLITLVLLIWKWMSIVLRKHHLLRCTGWLALLNWIIPCVISAAKNASKKIRALIHSIDCLSLPIECFPLTYDLSGFRSRIKWHLLSVGSFLTDFLYALIFLCFFFL